MNQGFSKADAGNLPRLDVFMVSQYFMDNAQYYSAEMKHKKTQKATRDTYGDNAVSYVQLKREGDVCIVQGKITPEHKIHKKPYNVECKVDEKQEKVISCICSGCAAALGGCKHSVAFLFWLHRRSEEPSVTAVECYWKKSKLARVGTADTCMSVKTMAGGHHSLCDRKPEMVDKFVKAVGKAKGGLFDFFHESELLQFDIYKLVLKYKSEKSEPYSAEEFLNFRKIPWVTTLALLRNLQDNSRIAQNGTKCVLEE